MKMYTSSQVADILQLAPKTVRKHAGSLGGKKIAGEWRWSPKAVERLVEDVGQSEVYVDPRTSKVIVRKKETTCAFI